MKTSVADRETKLFCLRIVATDGTTVRFVQYPHDIYIDSNLYLSDQGHEFTNFSATSDLSPSVIDMEGILTAAGIDRDGIESGVWSNAKCYLFATSWTNPVEDEEEIAKFLFGEAVLQDDRYVCRLVHLIDALSQSVGRSHGPLCPWTVFDETLDGQVIDSRLSKCGLDINDYKVTGTITSITNNRVFRDSSRSEAAEYFTSGSIKFTSGNNAGLRSQEIKQSYADGTINLFIPFHYSLQLGDAYEMIPGCLKRRTEDCFIKYNNVIHFGGFPDMPTSSNYQQVGSRR